MDDFIETSTDLVQILDFNYFMLSVRHRQWQNKQD